MHQSSDPAPVEQKEPIAAMLARVGAELEAAVARIHGLEDVVGHAISSARTPLEIQIQELQELDHVRQKIEGSAAFLMALSAMAAETWRIDAGEAALGLGMSSLARRLSGVPAAAAYDHEEVIELF